MHCKIHITDCTTAIPAKSHILCFDKCYFEAMMRIWDIVWTINTEFNMKKLKRKEKEFELFNIWFR
jgi:hypothetical protein